MTDSTTTFNRISGDKIKTDHMTYVPPEDMVIIYLHTCLHPETKEVLGYYVGSTNGPLGDRTQYLFSGYHSMNTITKFREYLLRYGCMYIESKILWVVPAELRAVVEQEEMDRYHALDLGFNSIRALDANPTAVYTISNKESTGYKKNNPTVQGAEDYALTMRHRDGSIESVTINRGLYERFADGKVLCLDHPGDKGNLCKHISNPTTKSGKTNQTALSFLANDLGHSLKFGPAEKHVLTLDNIYLTGTGDTRISLRTFLDQNPMYMERVPYLTIGSWSAKEVDA